MVKHTSVLSKNAIEAHHSKPGRIFEGILSNVSLLSSYLSGIVHFNVDVKCEEVCVCCQHVSRRVRDFIRHAERHQDISTIKATYISNMCDELRKRAADELELAEKGHVSRLERNNKRAREVGDVGSKATGTLRTKLHTVSIVNETEPANGINPLEMPSLSLHKARPACSWLFHAVDYGIYACLKCCPIRQRRLSEHFFGGVLSRVY